MCDGGGDGGGAGVCVMVVVGKEGYSEVPGRRRFS